MDRLRPRISIIGSTKTIVCYAVILLTRVQRESLSIVKQELCPPSDVCEMHSFQFQGSEDMHMQQTAINSTPSLYSPHHPYLCPTRSSPSSSQEAEKPLECAPASAYSPCSFHKSLSVIIPFREIRLMTMLNASSIPVLS